jgi:hypothetical protein
MSKLLILIMMFFSVATSFASTSIKGYREWKVDKVQVALGQTASTRTLLQKAKAEGQKTNVDSLERQLTQLQWNLDVAKDLSVTDYFVLYLSQLSQSDRFQQAAQKLSSSEVAELMEAYANTLGSSTPAETVTRQISPAPILQRLPVQAGQGRDR